MNSKKKKALQTAIIVCGAVVYLITVVLQLKFMIPGGPLKQRGNAANGLIAQFQVMDSVLLVIFTKKKGFLTQALLNFLNTSLVFAALIKTANVGSIPGAVIPLTTIATASILYSYISKTERINTELKESYQQAIEQNRIIQEKDESLRFLAYYDRLTGMPNRQLFNEELEKRISSGSGCIVLYADIDDFREINDTYGHATGDDIIREYSQKLTDYCGDSIFAAKLGGDQYAMILDGAFDKEDVTKFVDRVANIFSTPVKIRGDVFSLSASYGSAAFPTDSRSAEDLFRCAEEAMFKAKSQGKNKLVFHSDREE